MCADALLEFSGAARQLDPHGRRCVDMTVSGPVVSVVVPVRNEVGNVEPLVRELQVVLAPYAHFEVIYVDDGSRDGTGAEIDRLRSERPWLRHLRHDVSCGQSSAIRTGVKAARAAIVATIDGDGQNDPTAIPRMLARMSDAGPSCGLVAGQRVRRQVSSFKQLQSRVANAVREWALRDGTRDTGCGLKCFPRDVFLDLPFFNGLHRFMPALVRRDGYGVEMVDVVDRARGSGVSNYGFFDRLWIGIFDLMGVNWLIRRRGRVAAASEVQGHAR